MPLLKISNSRIIGTDYIVDADYHDGSPIVVMAGAKPSPPDPEAAHLKIELSSGSLIELRGPHATEIWEELSALAEDEDLAEDNDDA